MIPTKPVSNEIRPAGVRPDDVPVAAPDNDDGVQGEGNYEAARKFNEAESRFVASGMVDAAARAAAPTSEDERLDMLAAEEAGKRRAKGEEPALTRAWPDPVAK